MLFGLAIGIGIPAFLVGVYAWGRWMYGDQWYIALGKAASLGDDFDNEVEDAHITKLHLDR